MAKSRFLSGNWKGVKEKLGFAQRHMKTAIDKALLAEAEEARRQIVQGIKDQSPGGKKFKPLRELTLILRRADGFRGKKALIYTSALIKSISVKKNAEGYFIGVKRSARSKDGTRLYDIAAVHEYGTVVTIQVTPKMRAWLMIRLRRAQILAKKRGAKIGKGIGAGQMSTGVIVIRVPPRPFIGPVLMKMQKSRALRTRLLARVSYHLGLSSRKI